MKPGVRSQESGASATGRICTKCGEWKPRQEFYAEPRCKSGLFSYCKSCGNKASRARRAANPEKARAKNRAWRVANLEKARAKNRAWAVANLEKVRASTRTWRAANLEKVRASNRTWRAANPKTVRACSRATIKKAIENLSDFYVRSLLVAKSPLRAADIPDSLVALKRRELTIKRELKKIAS